VGTVSLVTNPALLAGFADMFGRGSFDAILTKTKTSCGRSLAEVRRLTAVMSRHP
jgi:hypothetical protein